MVAVLAAVAASPAALAAAPTRLTNIPAAGLREPAPAPAVLASAPVGLAATAAGAPPTTQPAPPPATAELLADLNTGRVLLAKNAHTRLPPASLTKMLTAMIAIDWLPANAVVPVTVRAANVSPDKVGMKAGQRWPFGIAMHALLISSANDAAYALAERVSGSVQHFAALMRLAAGELDMADHPVFNDPAGLDGTQGLDGGNRISTWDLAITARDLLAIPALAAIVRLKHYRFTGPDHIVYSLANHNRAFLNSYPGAIGVKTGYTDPAGVCVAEAATRNGRTMLAIVMNGVSPDRTAELLLNRGFSTSLTAERRDPALPAVHRPEPVPPTPPPTTVDSSAQSAPLRSPPSTASSARLASRSTLLNNGDEAMAITIGAALCVVATSAALLAGSHHHRRRRRHHRHSRRAIRR
jgi:D-alanyl-D-alanine carboxypeptidase (penicillin-binding protein 5/6)